MTREKILSGVALEVPTDRKTYNTDFITPIETILNSSEVHFTEVPYVHIRNYDSGITNQDMVRIHPTSKEDISSLEEDPSSYDSQIWNQRYARLHRLSHKILDSKDFGA